MSTTTLPYSVSLTRVTQGVDMGSDSFWSLPLHEMYAIIPFPDFWKGLHIYLEHMDDPGLDEKIKNKIISLKEFNFSTPQLDVAAGLYYPGQNKLELALFPDNWRTDYNGPLRSLNEGNKLYARRTLAHEVGHHFDTIAEVQTGRTRDDIGRLSYHWLLANLKPQTAALAENIAEHFRAAAGHKEVIGTFSDGKVADLSPELISCIRTFFYLSHLCHKRWVVSYVPVSKGVMYQIWEGLGWKWRFVSWVDWKIMEHSNGVWRYI